MWVGDALRLDRYWADSPPVHMLVAAYFGLGKKSAMSDDELADALGAAVSVAAEVQAELPVVGPPPVVHIREE